MNTLIEKLNLSGWPGVAIGFISNVALVMALIWGNTDQLITALAFTLAIQSTMGWLVRVELRKLKGQ